MLFIFTFSIQYGINKYKDKKLRRLPCLLCRLSLLCLGLPVDSVLPGLLCARLSVLLVALSLLSGSPGPP